MHQEQEESINLLRQRDDDFKARVIIRDDVESAEWRNHYSIMVESISNATVYCCGVQIVASEADIQRLPVPLHCSNEIRPNSAKVDINPREKRKFDVEF